MLNKEELRKKRKEAYQKAKAIRDADPSYQALMEKARQERRDKYRAFQDQQKRMRLEAQQKIRSEKDAALMALVMPASELEQQPIAGSL